MALLIASLRDSRAKTFPWPVGVQASMASDPAFSSTSSTMPTLAVRDTSFWRTSQGSLLPQPPLWTKLPPPKLLVDPTDLPEAEAEALTAKFTKRMALYSKEQPPASWENWPIAGGMRNGSLFPRPMWAPAMDECDGSAGPGGAWLTPAGMAGMDHTGKAGAGGEFAQQATEWSTPNASWFDRGQTSPEVWNQRMADRTARGQATFATPLHIQAEQAMWPTPDVCSGDRDMSKVDPQRQKRPDTKVTIGLPTAAGLWLTPNVPNGGRSVSEALVQSKGMTPEGEKKTVGLESQTRYWATPTASPNSNRGSKMAPSHGDGHGLVLAGQAGQWEPSEAESSVGLAWPTPRGTDGTKGGPNQAGSKGDLMLPSAAAQFLPVSARPTPASRDYRSPNSQSYQERGGESKGEQLNNFVEHCFSLPAQQTLDGQTSSPETPSSRRHLNPLFGSWLMGWTSTWTIAEPHASSASATVLFRSQLQQQLSCFFGVRGS